MSHNIFAYFTINSSLKLTFMDIHPSDELANSLFVRNQRESSAPKNTYNSLGLCIFCLISLNVLRVESKLLDEKEKEKGETKTNPLVASLVKLELPATHWLLLFLFPYSYFGIFSLHLCPVCSTSNGKTNCNKCAEKFGFAFLKDKQQPTKNTFASAMSVLNHAPCFSFFKGAFSLLKMNFVFKFNYLTECNY